MLVNVYHDTKREHRRLLLAGIGFLTAMALLIWLSLAIYSKAFSPATEVVLKAGRAGQQLPKLGDVRVHGVLVGYIKSVDTDGRHAVVTMAIQPDQAERIPAEVSAVIQPTTLFGQKFVELEVPDVRRSGDSLSDGDVIPASRVKTTVELQTILGNLYPLLRSVRPADLNATLYALSHALQGNGQRLGRTVDQLDSYLRAINAHVPNLRRDIALLAKVADTYDLAAPDLIRLLRNATTTARTVSQKEGDLRASMVGMTRLSASSRALLSRNEARLVAEGRYGASLLSLLDTYSPELPCVLRGLAAQVPNTDNVFRHRLIHQMMVFGAPQRKAYTGRDRPVYGEVGHGPWCLGLPDHYQKPAGYLPLRDGTSEDNPGGGLR